MLHSAKKTRLTDSLSQDIWMYLGDTNRMIQPISYGRYTKQAQSFPERHATMIRVDMALSLRKPQATFVLGVY